LTFAAVIVVLLAAVVAVVWAALVRLEA